MIFETRDGEKVRQKLWQFQEWLSVNGIVSFIMLGGPTVLSVLTMLDGSRPSGVFDLPATMMSRSPRITHQQNANDDDDESND
ncbi:MAG: hypothetical protein QF473_26985 [Planctomycetota bacterium]|nr:hypothetical protein [Planctomycetota bacterium]